VKKNQPLLYLFLPHHIQKLTPEIYKIAHLKTVVAVETCKK